MTVTKRYVWGIAIALVLGGILGLVGWGGFAASGAAETGATPLPAVRVESPTVRTVEETARYLATLEGRDDAVLAFRVSGTIGDIRVSEGETVTAGQTLVELSAPEVAARAERARMELARAEANLDHWRRELATDRRLFEKGAIPRTKLDQTQLTFTNTKRQRDAAAASLREAEHVASAHVLTAPRAGVTGRIEYQVGETIMPGHPVVQLNAGPRRLRVDVLAQDRRRGLHPGSFVRIEAPECEGQAGTVEQIETSARPPFESLRVYASVPEDCLAHHPSGSTVPVRIVLRARENAMLVPLSAIDLRGDHPRVFRIAPGREAEVVPVELGIQAGDYRQITGPLRPDDRIVTLGASNLTPGVRVHVDTAQSHTNPQRRAFR